MSVDLQPGETFAFASATQRQQIIDDKYTSTSEEGVLAALQQVQTKLIEARSVGGDVSALWSAEQRLMDLLTRSQWRWSRAAQSFQLRHDLLLLDGVGGADGEATAGALERVKNRLGATTDHHVQSIPTYAHDEDQTNESKKPSALADDFLSLDRLLPSILSTVDLNGLSQLSWEWLTAQPDRLSRIQLQQLLSQLTQPVLLNMSQLILRELNEPIPNVNDPNKPRMIQFGDTPIHRTLTLEQLQVLKEKKPELWMNSTTFVSDYLLKDRPFITMREWNEAQRDGGMSNEGKKAYLDRLWQAALDLPPQHGCIKGSIMFHVLWYGLTLTGLVDTARLGVYSAFPRTNGGEVLTSRSEVSSFGVGWDTQLTPVQIEMKRKELFKPFTTVLEQPYANEYNIFQQCNQANEITLYEAAIKQSLADVLKLSQGQDRADGWLKYVNPSWALRVGAIAALTTPGGTVGLTPLDLDALKTRLGPSELARLRSSIRLEFGSLDRSRRPVKQYRSSESVVLDVLLKNVPTLIVKIFHIHGRNFFTKKLQEIDPANLELDGLTPKEELKFEYGQEENWSEYIVQQRQLPLDLISRSQRGIFVVELVGAGYRTRCILRKGSLVALSSQTAQGHMFRMLDEESGRPIDNGGTIFVNGQTYHAEKTTGCILVPYSANANPNQKIVLMTSTPMAGAGDSSASDSDAASDSTFATLSTFSHLPETYQFSCGFFVDRESLLSKTRATVLVSPTLTIHGEKVQNIDRMLKETSLRIDTIAEDGLPSTQIVQPFLIANDRESTHTFIVPDHLKSITFTLNGVIHKYSNGEKQPVSDSESFQINSIDTTHFIEDLYLKHGLNGKRVLGATALATPADAAADGDDGEWCIYAAGRTGEPIRNRTIALQLTHSYLRHPLHHLPGLTLTTDASGCIRLGRLEHVTRISATPIGIDADNITIPQRHEWNLGSANGTTRARSNQAQKRREWTAQVGETINIPWTGTAAVNVEQELMLFEDLGSRQLGKNLTRGHVDVVVDDRTSALRVFDLPAGHYVLLCKAPLYFSGGLWHSWTIHIVDGTRVMGEWILDRASKTFIQTEKPDARKNGKLTIVNVARQEASAASSDSVPSLSIRLSGVTPSTRVHVCSSNFAPEWSMLDQLTRATLRAPTEFKTQRYNVQSSMYLGQKLLGDEVSYILQRKLEGDRIGNMLPRPSLFLHDRVKQDTQFAADPTLSAGEAYTEADVRRATADAAIATSYSGGGGFGFGAAPQPQAAALYGAAPAQARMAMRRGFVGGPANGDDDGGASVGIVRGHDGGSPSQRHDYEFLSEPSTLLSNLRPNGDGEVSVPLSSFASTHNTVTIFVTDGTAAGVTSERIGLKPPSQVQLDPNETSADLRLDLAYRDTRLMPPLDPTKRYSEQHLITLLHAGDSLTIDDIRTSTYESFETLDDYWNLIQILTKNQYQQGLVEELNKFHWLVDWLNLSDDVKELKYSEFACHELHIYLYYKDRPFFQRVIQPFLRNKLQKTFIDVFLLDHDLTLWLQPHAFETLNVFERILLARSLLQRGGDGAEAQAAHAKGAAILDLIIQTSMAQSREDTEEYIAFFKTAMQSKSMANSGDNDGDADGRVGKGGRENREMRKEKAADMMRDQSRMMPPPPPPSGVPIAQACAMPMRPAAAAMMMRCEAEPAPSFAPPPGMARSRAAPMKKSKMMSLAVRGLADEDDDDDGASSDDSEGGGGGFDDFAATLDARDLQARRLYQAPPTTKEYEERNYWNVTSSQPGNNTDLVQLNRFWSDYASHLKKCYANGASSSFLTSNLGAAFSTFTDLLFRLSVLDLPLRGSSNLLPPVISGSREKSLKFQAPSQCIVFHQEMKQIGGKKENQGAVGEDEKKDEREPGEISSSATSAISVSCNYLDPLDLFQDSMLVDGGADAGLDERQDKYLTDEFLTFKIYGCRVVLTNISSTRQKVSVLLQIPEGSIPVGSWAKKGLSTETKFVEIGSYSSQVLTYLFYWPAAGQFRHYPPSATKKGRSVGFGSGGERQGLLRVVHKPTKIVKNLFDWKQLSQNGTNEEVLEFLKKQNLIKVQLNLVCWRFNARNGNGASSSSSDPSSDPARFWRSVTQVLRDRLMFDRDIWSFCFQFYQPSNEIDTKLELRELLSRCTEIHSALGAYFRTSLITKDDADAEWNEYQHLEYSPLLNARAHTLRTSGGGGGRRRDGSSTNDKNELRIQNIQFQTQYGKFLDYLRVRVSGVEQFEFRHKLAATYYLLLQERYQEAKKMFDTITPPKAEATASSSSAMVDVASSVDSSCALQYDYLLCYFAFFTADPSSALPIAKRYSSYPISKKRKLFAEVEQQLMELSAYVDREELIDEYSKEPHAGHVRDEQDRQREMGNLANSEPTIDFNFHSASAIEIQCENVSELKVNFYKMHVELMFSSSPFMLADVSSSVTGGGGGQSGAILWVTPNDTLTVHGVGSDALAPSSSSRRSKPVIVQLPEKYLKTNCWIEVTNSAGVAGQAGQAPAGAGGLAVVKPHFANELTVQLSANYGQLKVVHSSTGRPLPQTYIKVYGRPKDGSPPSFFKDGYTDLRGRFDYASLSTDKLSTTSKFAILILHHEFGAVVKVADTPQQ